MYLPEVEVALLLTSLPSPEVMKSVATPSPQIAAQVVGSIAMQSPCLLYAQDPCVP